MTPGWQFFIDVGGTFTDVAAVRPDGKLVTHKLLSSGATRGGIHPAPAYRSRALSPAQGAPEQPIDCRVTLTYEFSNRIGVRLGRVDELFFEGVTCASHVCHVAET
jgi:hypothetical protein